MIVSTQLNRTRIREARMQHFFGARIAFGLTNRPDEINPRPAMSMFRANPGNGSQFLQDTARILSRANQFWYTASGDYCAGAAPVDFVEAVNFSRSISVGDLPPGQLFGWYPYTATLSGELATN